MLRQETYSDKMLADFVATTPTETNFIYRCVSAGLDVLMISMLGSTVKKAREGNNSDEREARWSNGIASSRSGAAGRV